jgi:RHS repeat-associated protein
MRALRFLSMLSSGSGACMRLLLAVLMSFACLSGSNALAQAVRGEVVEPAAPPPDEGEEPYNDARMVIQSVPTSMLINGLYNVSVSMRNSGTKAWYKSSGYRLASVAPPTNTTWGLNRVELATSMTGGGNTAQFDFQVRAPSTPGTYTFQWQMLQEGVEWFGLPSSRVTITVREPAAPPASVNDAQVVSISVPVRMQTKLSYNVAVTMRNSGTTTWTPGELYRLGSQNPRGNQTWGLGRVDIAKSVARGQQYTFNFQVTAPVAGSYDMQWGMLQESVQWFGGTASGPVTVTENLGNVTFIHTDGLGSPVARTDAAGNVISRTRYEPYGYVASGATPTIGFTGHVNDADTGLTYMQQRYYDPVAGRFLSTDPVTTDANTGLSFNRYAYANNSPHRYIDPDGRFSAQTCADMGSLNCTNIGSGSGPGSSQVSTSAKVGVAVGDAAAGLAAAGCDIYSLGGCAVANPAMVAGGIAGGAALGAITGQQLDVAWSQLNRLLEKATNNSTGPTEIHTRWSQLLPARILMSKVGLLHLMLAKCGNMELQLIPMGDIL